MRHCSPRRATLGWAGLIITIGLILLTGCAHRSGALEQILPKENEKVSLEQLALRLQLVRGVYDLGGGNVSSLVGQDAWAIRERLGAPDESEWSKGISIFPATWAYHFYRATVPVFGRGHVLILRFDGTHRCIQASWRVDE